MIEVMGLLMGVDIQSFSRPEDGPSEPSPTPPSQSAWAGPSTSVSDETPSAKIEEVEMEDPEPEQQDFEEKELQAAAEEQKKIGNDAYRKRDFEKAAAAFQKAWDTWPKDITFLTNLSGS